MIHLGAVFAGQSEFSAFVHRHLPAMSGSKYALDRGSQFTVPSRPYRLVGQVGGVITFAFLH